MPDGSVTGNFATFFVTERGAKVSVGRVKHSQIDSPLAYGVSKGITVWVPSQVISSAHLMSKNPTSA